jgi:hypothetical protein
VRDELVVVLVGDDDAGATLAAGVDVDGELVFGLGLAGAGAGGFGDGAVDLTADFADAVGGGDVVSGVLRGGMEGVGVTAYLPRVKREKCSSMVSTQHSSVAGLLSFCQICSGGQRLVARYRRMCWQGAVGGRGRTPMYEIPMLAVLLLLLL